jgi:signal transduction histidine kinase
MLKKDPKKKLIYIKSILDDTLYLLKDSLINYNIEFLFDGDENTQVAIVASEFKHILINIINNAKDEFVSKKIEKPKILFQWETRKNCIELNITDNAQGIPIEIIDSIFDLNFTTKEEGKGSGMGLYMTKLFCDKMDIEIKALNIDDGACFNIKIPILL